MRRSLEILTLVILLGTVGAAGALAEIPDKLDLNAVSRGELGKIEEVVKTPEEQAIDHYNQGIALIQRADKMVAKSETLEGAKREKTLKKAGKALHGAALEFNTATTKNPRFPEAYSLLGYVRDRAGQYEEAVAAFDAALALRPDDLRSLSARGNSLLALGRLNDAKETYLLLSEKNHDQAQGLLARMAAWAEGRDSDPQAAELAAWIQEVRTRS